MNADIIKGLAARGFINTSGCHFQKVVGVYTLRVWVHSGGWVHSEGGQAEVKSRISRDYYSRVARLPEFDVVEELDKFFAPYGGGQ